MPEDSSCPVYQLLDVCLHLNNRPILQGLNFQVQQGERVAVLGPSGAGKSSLLRLLNGSLKPSAGEMTLLGQPVSSLAPRNIRLLQRQVGTIYQQFHLVSALKVIHNVNAGHLARWPLWKSLLSLLWPQSLAQAQSVLETVGIPEHLFSPTAQLSGGQQQRVAIARLLIQNPSIILADEPVSSLDPRLSQDILTLLTDLTVTHSRTLIISLHDVALAQQFCNRVLGLRQGQIFFDCAIAQLTPEKLSALYATARDT
ncbi:phosphonate ABC transporter ATP-binding protein [Lyngbya confervoides]|uniref:ATP-binding cassette domain-containing protein n=1 Tax=Lyngbya confervoides BDU141951 TaxID=1574623 RepID=A0ABD4T6J7_9CYAN|nr:ATP-binding cassette domain-containing protein [Lyngbya confervoides]MCM1984105.1 ATP-binding cassette domain-containing protein [Lyngbya confervoides BDU141951]